MRLLFVAFSLLLVLQFVGSVPHDEPQKVLDVLGNTNAQDPTSQFFSRADVGGEQQQEVQTFAEHSTKIEGSPVNKLTEDDSTKPFEFSNLPQNSRKPSGFSQLPINETPKGFLKLPHNGPASIHTGKPTGLPVLSHDAQEPTRLSKLPKYNQDQPSIFPATSRGANVNSPSTKHPLVEKLFKMISGNAARSENNDVNNDIDSGNVQKLDEENKDYEKFKRSSERPSGKTGSAGDSGGAAKEFQEENYVESSSEGIIPPTTSSVRFSSRGSYKIRRRKRRSTEDDDNDNDDKHVERIRLVNVSREDDCSNSLSKAVLAFLASVGWFAALAAVLPCCLSRFRICRRLFPDPVDEDNESQSNILIEDVEMGIVTETDDDKEVTLYEKHNSGPTSYCNIETINEESSTTETPTSNCDVETFKEEDITTSTLSQFPVESSMVDGCASAGYCTVETLNEEGLTANLPPIAPPLPKVVEVETNDKEVSKNDKTMEKVKFQFDMDCKTQRRASERVKVIRRLSSSIRRPSLLDEILVAREVILDENLKNAKVFERRKVIKEATAHERKGSLLEEICFAKSVISPSEEDRERNENSYHRRHLIKERSSSRRVSLADNITMAKDVLLGTVETLV